jgi:hypothetical protein
MVTQLLAAKAGRQALELGTADTGDSGANGARSGDRKHRQYRCR